MDIDRDKTLDIARGTAILAVVLVHAVALRPGPAAIRLGGTASIALAVLFLVSGHVAGHRLLAPAVRPADVAARVVPLLWIYALWQPVVLVQRIVLAAAQDGSVSLAGEVARWLATPVRPNGELWYLWALAIHLLVLTWTRQAAPALVLAPAAALFIIGNGAGPELLGDHVWHLLGPGLQGLPQFAFFTFLGARLPTLVPVHHPAALVVVACGCSVSLIGLHLGNVAAQVRPIETLVGVLLVLALLGVTRHVSGRRNALAVLEFVGARSVAPYLGHMSVLTALLCAVTSAGSVPDALVPTITWITAAVATAVLVPIVVLESSSRTPLRWLFRAPPSVIDLVARRVSRGADRSATDRRG